MLDFLPYSEQTRSFIRDAVDLVKQFKANPVPDVVMKKRDKDRDESENLVINSGGNHTCRPNTLTLNLTSLDNIDFSILESKLGDEFLDPVTMYEALCVYQSMTVAPTMGGGSPVSSKVIRYLDNMKRIGVPSVAGDVALSSTGVPGQGVGRATVITKTPKGDNEMGSTHEFFIGAYGTNRLRNYIPNFALVYSRFKCAPPLVATDDDKVLDFCGDGEPVSYIMYEAVKDARSFADHTLYSAEFRDVYNCIMQICYSLDMASTMIGFTHYDLHADNVLIRPLPDKYGGSVYLDYDLPGGDLFRVNDIATVIDFGYSRIMYEGKSYGVNGLEYANVNANVSNILYDIYKLIAGLAWVSERKGLWQREYARMLRVAFFPSADPATFLEEFGAFLDASGKYYHSLPYTTPDNFNIHEFLGRIRSEFPEYEGFWTPRSHATDYHIADRPSAEDVDLAATKELDILTNGQKFPTDVVGFVDVYTSSMAARNRGKYRDQIELYLSNMFRNFDHKAFDRADKEITDYSADANRLANFVVPDPHNTSPGYMDRIIELDRSLEKNIHSNFLIRKAMIVDITANYAKKVLEANGYKVDWTPSIDTKDPTLVNHIVAGLKILDTMIHHGVKRSIGYAPREDYLRSMENASEEIRKEFEERARTLLTIRSRIHEYTSLFGVDPVMY